MPLAALSVTAKESVAVEPAAPSSTLGEEIDTAGGLSSSTMVSVTSAGSDTAPRLATVPEIVTVWFGSSAASSTAERVTVPTLVPAAAAKISVVAALSAKSPESAPVPGAADTVTVTGSFSTGLNTAVTVATPPVSEIDVRDNENATHRSAVVVHDGQRLVRRVRQVRRCPRPPFPKPSPTGSPCRPCCRRP